MENASHLKKKEEQEIKVYFNHYLKSTVLLLSRFTKENTKEKESERHSVEAKRGQDVWKPIPAIKK